MNHQNFAQLMALYNQWMNQKIYAAAAQLNDQERKQDRGAFFSSIHQTLEHILWGDRIWLARFNGKNYPRTNLNEPMFDDFAQLQNERAIFDQEIIQWSQNIDEHWLKEMMTWSSQLYKFTQTQPRYALVLHMFNHQTHHRGQVTALLSQAGVDCGVTDLPMLLQEMVDSTERFT